MGLYTYFFEKERWIRQYNCTFYSVEDVALEKRQHLIYAAIVLTLFVVYEILYIPCLYAMLKKQVRQNFCYKLMLEMALYDVFTLPLTALLPGIYSMNGYMFCSFPVLSYMAGGVIFPLWIGYSMTSLILAINRCLAFSKYKTLFEGAFRQAFWILLPLFASVFVIIFGQSITYNSILGAWFFNPHLGYFEDVNAVYPSSIQFWNNIIFCTVLPTVYVWFFLSNWAMSKKRMSGGMSAKEYRLFTQCLLINLTICAAAAGYMLMQYLNLPTEFIAFSHVAWIIVEGAPPVVLLSMNETIRKIVFGRKGKRGTTQHHSSTNGANAQSQPKLTDSQIIG
ncbi:hypothetical protein M3Y97_00985000 [Aphelenchoides bicaudatus]|nr:hypothetical protein M3Y97_00985000 [Aphelenchoides bicaudatus]